MIYSRYFDISKFRDFPVLPTSRFCHSVWTKSNTQRATTRSLDSAQPVGYVGEVVREAARLRQVPGDGVEVHCPHGHDPERNLYHNRRRNCEAMRRAQGSRRASDLLQAADGDEAIHHLVQRAVSPDGNEARVRLLTVPAESRRYSTSARRFRSWNRQLTYRHKVSRDSTLEPNPHTHPHPHPTASTPSQDPRRALCTPCR